jgi:acetyl-CoA C-acetyltransferase
MTFAGGPLNSYVLHATAAMAVALRESATASVGVVTSVSAMLTKVGLGVWSRVPPAVEWADIDVSRAAERATPLRPFTPDGVGSGHIVGATVVHVRGIPDHVVAVVELDDGPRTVAVERDPSLAARVVDDDLCGQPVAVPSSGVLAWS